MPTVPREGSRPRPSVTLKVSLAGDPGVGKTALVRRFVTDTFGDRYITTLGTKVSSKQFPLTDPERKDVVHEVGMGIWDVMGHESFREILKEAYFTNANGVLLICDGTRDETLYSLARWYEAVASVAGPVPAVVLVNKSDLAGGRKILPSEVEPMCSEFGWPWFSTSAKTGENVEAAFRLVAQEHLRALRQKGTLLTSPRPP